MNWNPLKKQNLTTKPASSQGLVSSSDDEKLENIFLKLQDLEGVSKKLYKVVKKYEDCICSLRKQEHKLSSELCESQLCQENVKLKKLVEDYLSVVNQMSQHTGSLADLSRQTVVEPMKKLTGEFLTISNALKKRDNLLAECLRCQSKFEKLDKQEKTGTNIVKTEQAKKALKFQREEFERENKLLLTEFPQFYEKRVDYFQPSLQALIRAQVDYYGETNKLFTQLVSGNTNSIVLINEEQYEESVEKKLADIKSLSIVEN